MNNGIGRVVLASVVKLKRCILVIYFLRIGDSYSNQPANPLCLIAVEKTIAAHQLNHYRSDMYCQ